MMNLNVEMSSMWSAFLTWLVSMLPRLAASVLLFGLGWWLSNVVTRLMRRAVTRAKGDAGVTTFLSSLLNILLKVIISIMAIAQLGVDVTSLIAAIGCRSCDEGQYEQCGERRTDCPDRSVPCW